MNTRNIIFSLLSVMLFVSCNKVLDTNPDYNIDGGEGLKTIEDHDFALVGAYRLFRSTNYYGSTDGSSNAFGLLPDLLGDNLVETDESLGNEQVFSRWTYTANEDQVESTWLDAYRIISQANIVLNGIEKYAADNQGAVNRIKGQALAIRAMVHFDLLRYWANNYERNSGDPGIPYINVYNYEAKPARGTVKQDYDNIEKDLLEARTLLQNVDKPINVTRGNTRAYMDATVVNAILARMYLYAGVYDKAIQSATSVINAIPLATITQFPNIWTDATNADVIWSYTFDAGQGGPGYHAYFPQPDASQYGPDPSLLALYDPNTDVRYDAYFGDISGRTVLIKYMAKEAQLSKPDGTTNFKVFRTGEMYLIRAEAYARSTNDLLGVGDLNTLRRARISGYVNVNLSGNALLTAIATERRKELAAEGHRFFDLKRSNRTIARVNCTSFCTLGASNRAWSWPIPQPEIDANPAILPQNPGY